MAKARTTAKKSKTKTGTRAAGDAGAIDPALGPLPASGAATRPVDAKAVAKTAARSSAVQAFAIEAARLLSDDKCEDVVLLDVRGLSPMCDFIVIGSGTSDRQMRATIDEVVDMGRTQGFGTARRNVDDRATWCVADLFDVVVHVFEPNTRAYYDLEMLWGDAPKMDWARPAGAPTPRSRTKKAKAEPDGQEGEDEAHA